MLAASPSRTCDFTLGGIFLWDTYFRYTRAIHSGTIFIRGMAEDDLTLPAFSLPVGQLPLARSLPLLRRHCRVSNVVPFLSAVPEDRLDEILTLFPDASVTELPDWADYLYNIEPMTSFAGKAMSKKRNHVNRFAADHPDAFFKPIEPHDIPSLIDFLDRHSSLAPEKSITADYDLMKTRLLLSRYGDYPFEGALLGTPGLGIVAFTIGEALGDTLYVHIEKMDHTVNGSGETVSSRFCRMMGERHSGLRFVNREDSSGDPGLARAKEAYRPCALLRKYNVELPSL